MIKSSTDQTSKTKMFGIEQCPFAVCTEYVFNKYLT